MDKNFVLNLHNGYSFPLDMLRNYIHKNTNIIITDFKKITDGYDNEVYDTGLYMVKIRRGGEVPYSCIKWAVERCREQNVKVPEIIHCGKISGLDILIEEKIKGNPLKPAMYEEAGAELKKIHSIKVSGFWRRHKDGTFDFNSYDEISFPRDRLAEIPLIRAGNIFDSEDIDYMKEMLYQAEKFIVNPVLCHGDYCPRHIICENNINGIIDFGDFSGGSIYSDIAYFSLNSDESYFDKFIKGYGKINEKELTANKVIQLMGYLAHSRKIGDEEDAKLLEQKLLRIIKSSRTK